MQMVTFSMVGAAAFSLLNKGWVQVCTASRPSFSLFVLQDEESVWHL